jgi:hypothetical protein
MPSPTYISYQCTVCKRLKQLPNLTDRPDPLRCNITLKCRGMLKRVGSSYSLNSLTTPVIAGLEDYTPRTGPTLPIPAAVLPAQISMLTSNNFGSLTMSMLTATINGTAVTYSVQSTEGLGSLTSIGTLATAYRIGHGYVSGQEITVSNAYPSPYNGSFMITVTDADHFTYPLPVPFIIVQATPITSGSSINVAGNFIVESGTTASDFPLTTVVNLLLYEITTQLLDYSKFTYEINGTVSQILGPDDSPQQLNLRFTSSNSIAIYVNGVLLDSSAYDRSVDNQITFSPSIVDSSNLIEVFVYLPTSQLITGTTVTLTFKPLTTSNGNDVYYRNQLTYGDVGGAMVDGTTRYLLYCTDLSALDITKTYSVQNVNVTSSVSGATARVLPTEIRFLLAKEPYAFEDKDLHAYVAGETIIATGTVISFVQSEATGQYYLGIPDSFVTQIFNPVIPLNTLAGITEDTPAVLVNVPGSTEVLKRKFILGPS